MKHDRADWDRALEERKKSASAPATKIQTETQRAAAILGNKLASDPLWIKFQEEAARHINKAQMAKATYQVALLDAATVSADELTRAKIGFHAHQAMIDSFEMMLDFPNKHKNS
jgi:hypothetical protein